MIRKKYALFVICLVLLMLISACGQSEEGNATLGDAATVIADSVKSFIKGDVTGELNKSYSTKWFDFTVKTIKTAYEYGDFIVDDGYKFVIVAVSETNTFNEPIPMSAYDFYIDADGLPEEDQWSVEPFADKMMPEEFELAIGETGEYDVVFVIPDELIDIRFVYVEIDINDNIGATFTINHSL